jgi:riboflavin synthase
MFTGIVEELGEVVGLEQLPDAAARLSIRAATVVGDAERGASIAVNGVCLTVVEHGPEGFTADVMRETLQRSSLAQIEVGARVNLERAVTLSTRMGGHLVQGHVDGVGVVRTRNPHPHWDVVEIDAPPHLLRYVVEKGSITVDGVSLTVAGVSDRSFTVSLIPTTMELTTLGLREPGDAVNLEVDVLAKYVERLLTAGTAQ